MKYGVKISRFSSALPEKVIKNEDLQELFETTSEWIEERTGIKERRISPAGQDSLYLSVEASKKALENLSPEKLDLIIVATSTSEYLYPSTACRLQAEIKAENALCFDLIAACSGFVFAMANACQFIQNGTYKNALVVGVDVHSHFLDWKDRSTAILFGDGAGAVLLESCKPEENEFLSHTLRCYGGGAAELTIKSSRSGFPEGKTEKQTGTVEMNGKKIYQFAVQKVPELILSSLESVGLSAQDVDYFVCHQANQRILDSMADKLGVQKEKFPSNMSRYGNTSAASIPIVLDEIKANFTEDKILCMSGFGAGLTAGSLVWKLRGSKF